MALNLPSGTAVKTAIDLATVDFSALVLELQKKSFNGYACMSVMGAGGVEEGTLIFDEGKIAACLYEYFAYNKVLEGELAFPRIINASLAKKGVIDIFQLTAQQVQLFLAFNENSIFVPAEKDVKPPSPAEFSPFFEEQIKEIRKTNSKEDLMKKLKISGAGFKKEEAPQMEELEVIEGEKEDEEDMLSEIMKASKKASQNAESNAAPKT